MWLLLREVSGANGGCAGILLRRRGESEGSVFEGMSLVFFL